MQFAVSEPKEQALRLKMRRLGIREEDLQERFIRSSGRGGQKVNKTSSCVYLKHRPTGIEVKCQQERSQALNRFLARRRLVDKIETRLLGRLSEENRRIEKIRRQKRKRSKRAKEKMLQDKRERAEKKRMRMKALLLTVIILSLACTACAKTESANVLVAEVIDGDTLRLADGEKVRLLGIDAPEMYESDKLYRDIQRTGQDRETIMAMGRESYQFTQKLAEGRQVRLEFDVEKRDKYGRLLAYVFISAPPLFLNAEIIAQGYAQPMTIPPNLKYTDYFQRLYQEARENKRGLRSNDR